MRKGEEFGHRSLYPFGALTTPTMLWCKYVGSKQVLWHLSLCTGRNPLKFKVSAEEVSDTETGLGQEAHQEGDI